jgi:hypothetical protein
LMSAFPSCSAFDRYTSTSRTEISISKFYQWVSMRALIMFWAFIAVCLISKWVCAWWASLNHCLIFEWTEKPLRAVKTLNRSHLWESSIKAFNNSKSICIRTHKSCRARFASRFTLKWVHSSWASWLSYRISCIACESSWTWSTSLLTIIWNFTNQTIFN